MAEVVVSKQVFFIGAWRTPNVTDQLLSQISKQMFQKEGYSTLLNLTADGLYLNINDANGQTTKTDRIPLEIIADFIDNKYNSTCILAIVKDKNQYSVFVFLCRCEQDSAAMVQAFQQLKKKLSGEGYNLDMKQTGVNWTLKNKEGDGVTRQQNGDVRVHNMTTARQNSGGDSVSHTSLQSDVREELTDLAKEVRDIRLMMAKSHGRHHFAKHYGYLNSPPPTQTSSSQRVFTEEMVVTPKQVSNNLSVKRHYVKREAQPSVVLVRDHGGQFKQRASTSGHYIKASSQSSMAGSVRRRVYPSPSPVVDGRYANSQINGQSIKVANAYQQPILQRSVRSGSSSDIVHKNIEHVYKSKKMYKRIVPVSPVSPVHTQTYDYVQSQHQQQQHPVVEEDVAPVRSVFINEGPPQVIKRAPTHIRYQGYGGDYMYENTAMHHERQDLSNISTLANVSTNDTLDETRQGEVNMTEAYRASPQSEQMTIVQSDGQQVRRDYEEDVNTTYVNGSHSGNVIVMQGDRDVVTSSSSTMHEGDNVIYIKSNHTVIDEPQQQLGGGVYHVRAKGLENFDQRPEDDNSNVVIMDPKEYERIEEPTSSNVTVIRNDANDLKTKSANVTMINTNVDEGLWGEYAKPPEPYDPNVEIEKDSAYRYNHDENETGITDFEDVQQEVSDEIETSSDVTTQKRVRYLDEVEQTLENESNEKVDDIEQHAEDAVENETGFEVNDIIDKVNGADDENNNGNRVHFDDVNDAKDNIDNDIDFRASKGSVVSELRDKFTQEVESNVLF